VGLRSLPMLVELWREERKKIMINSCLLGLRWNAPFCAIDHAFFGQGNLYNIFNGGILRAKACVFTGSHCRGKEYPLSSHCPVGMHLGQVLHSLHKEHWQQAGSCAHQWLRLWVAYNCEWFYLVHSIPCLAKNIYKKQPDPWLGRLQRVLLQ